MNGLGRNRRLAQAAAAVLAAVCASALAAGCGSSSSRTAASPAASLKRAAYVSTGASGYKEAMTMTETVSGSSGQKTIDMTANASFSPASRKGQMTMSMQLPTAVAGSQTLDLQAVLDGGTIYMKLPSALTSQIPGGKPWISIDLGQLGKLHGVSGLGSLVNSSSTMNDPGQYLDYLRATSDGSVKDLGQETVNGVQTTHYQAEVDLAKLPDAVPAADKQVVQQLTSTLQSKGVNTKMPVDAWIDATHHVRRIHITYSTPVQSESVTTDITTNLSDYGPQPAPTVPSPDETTNLLSLVHGG